MDTGDITDHGTKAENKFVEEIGTLGVPYVFVRGNHDSKTTQQAVARQKNAVVLDDTASRPSRACASTAWATPGSPRTRP